MRFTGREMINVIMRSRAASAASASASTSGTSTNLSEAELRQLTDEQLVAYVHGMYDRNTTDDECAVVDDECYRRGYYVMEVEEGHVELRDDVDGDPR